MKKKLKWIFGGGAVVFLLLQLTNPARTNPPLPPGGDMSATSPAPPEVAALLHAACYNCHSYETKWPWYSHIAPVSWLVGYDVNGGRKRLNLSDWPGEFPDRAARRLENMSENIGYGDMPPWQYKMVHPEARLTQAQRDLMTKWLDAEAARLKASGGTGTNDAAK
jgi:hypothetical protein